MPTQNVTCCKDKVVLVRVYVEKPRKKRESSNHHHHHHHYHFHQTFRREVVQGTAGKGYDRKAELLRYSQRLRQSARSAPSIPLLSNKQIPNNNRQLIKIVPSQRKPKTSEKPSCFGNWKLTIPSFLRSLTSTKSKKKRKRSGLSSSQTRNVIKKLESQMKRKSASISKFLSTTRKRS
ncbi:hypothetical protein L6164_019683 [Bauhinia variegata]|uniref:Uncharacterized protein n=1 Tax=Bauhinia variegata TaxID=167791 RepID=A0ACB9MSJ1_BAUVA|nr:hypothetical protein L6164_019683 [Bauhinia variegata]